jgi:putative tryptophan/tyrosine transport system substrate-binding protein
MRRREFIGILGSAAAWATPLLAQTPRARPLIAYLGRREGMPPFQDFVDLVIEGLRELGYTEGKDFDIVAKPYIRARIAETASELAQLKPDIIVAPSTLEAIAVKKVTTSIPIVVPAFANPVGSGLVASEARPGGDLTGIAPYVKGLPGKQVELAREVVPGANRIGLLNDPIDPKSIPQRPEIEAAAKQLNIHLITADVRVSDDIEPAYQLFATEGVQVVIVEQSGFLLYFSRRIAELAAATSLPTVYGYREHVLVGGLISYGVNLHYCFHRAAYFVDRILKGGKPADLPIEFPTTIELVINLKTARALGLNVPPNLLARADEVIE